MLQQNFVLASSRLPQYNCLALLGHDTIMMCHFPYINCIIQKILACLHNNLKSCHELLSAGLAIQHEISPT